MSNLHKTTFKYYFKQAQITDIKVENFHQYGGVIERTILSDIMATETKQEFISNYLRFE